VSKILNGVNTVKSYIDAGVSYDPTKYAVLAWTVVSFGVQIACNAEAIRNAALDSSKYLTDILQRYTVIEALYRSSDETLSRTSRVFKELEEAIVEVYASILLYIIPLNAWLQEYSISKLES
jgi:hypothetical protein